MEALLQVTFRDGSAARGLESNVRNALAAWHRYAITPGDYPFEAAQTSYPLQDIESGVTVLVRAIHPDYVAMVTEVPARDDRV